MTAGQLAKMFMLAGILPAGCAPGASTPWPTADAPELRVTVSYPHGAARHFESTLASDGPGRYALVAHLPQDATEGAIVARVESAESGAQLAAPRRQAVSARSGSHVKVLLPPLPDGRYRIQVELASKRGSVVGVTHDLLVTGSSVPALPAAPVWRRYEAARRGPAPGRSKAAATTAAALARVEAAPMSPVAAMAVAERLRALPAGALDPIQAIRTIDLTDGTPPRGLAGVLACQRFGVGDTSAVAQAAVQVLMGEPSSLLRACLEVALAVESDPKGGAEAAARLVGGESGRGIDPLGSGLANLCTTSGGADRWSCDSYVRRKLKTVQAFDATDWGIVRRLRGGRLRAVALDAVLSKDATGTVLARVESLGPSLPMDENIVASLHAASAEARTAGTLSYLQLNAHVQTALRSAGGGDALVRLADRCDVPLHAEVPHVVGAAMGGPVGRILEDVSDRLARCGGRQVVVPKGEAKSGPPLREAPPATEAQRVHRLLAVLAEIPNVPDGVWNVLAAYAATLVAADPTQEDAAEALAAAFSPTFGERAAMATVARMRGLPWLDREVADLLVITPNELRAGIRLGTATVAAQGSAAACPAPGGCICRQFIIPPGRLTLTVSGLGGTHDHYLDVPTGTSRVTVLPSGALAPSSTSTTTPEESP